MTDETWRPVAGFEGVYEVSDQGRVRRVLLSRGTSGGPLRPRRDTAGYVRVVLHGPAGRYEASVHRLVLDTFVGPAPGMAAHHRNGQKTDNRLVNLEWTTSPTSHGKAYTPEQRARRFWARVDRNGPGGCWLWLGALDKDGYGRWSPATDVSESAHRGAYKLTRGPIPEGLQIDHLCRTRACVRPDHMELVTARDNTLRGLNPTAMNARKTHCKRGHPFDAENTIVEIDSRGRSGRHCRICRRYRLGHRDAA